MNEQTRADELTAKYIKLRDFHAKKKAEFDEQLGKIKSIMEQIEMDMMTFLNQTGQESSKSTSGTFFKKSTTSARVADRDIFLQFVIDHDALNFLENRVNDTAVAEYVAVHGTVPPGVDVTTKVSVGVNRPKSR